MKKFFYAGLLTAALVSLGSCSEDNGGWIGEATGGIAPSVNLNSEIITSRASAKEIAVEQLSLRLSKSDGSFSNTWDYASFPTDNSFKIGDYTLEAFYGDEGVEGFDKPYYYGVANVKVLENQATPVQLTAQLANAMVQINYTDNFRKYFSNYSSTVSAATDPVYYGSDETRPVYVNPGTVNITTSMTTPQGKDTKFKANPFQAQARHLYNVTFDIDNNPGNAVLTITYDDALEMEDIVINLDDLEAAPEPVFSVEGFAQGTPVEVVEGVAPANPVKVNMIARAGISSVKLSTVSKSLRQQGWPAEVELVSADASTQTILSSLGLNVRGLFRNPDQMAVIDFSAVANHLRYVDSGDNETTFTINLTDRFDRAMEPVTLSFNTLKAICEYGEFEPLYYNSSELSFTLKYNGADIEKNVEFLYQNDRGTDSKAPFKSVSAVSDNIYKVTLTVPANESDILLKGKFGATNLPEKTIVRVGDALVADENDIFATSAKVSVMTTSRATGDVKIFAIDNNGSVKQMAAQAVANGYLISGLNPATTYKMFAEIDGRSSKSASFTTEQSAQLPVEQFNDWRSASSGSNWTNWQIGDGNTWGTNNPMTTSQGADFGYTRSAGTLATTDAHSNGSAILLRTIGWGSGNTAVGSLGTRKMKYADAGLLHLGASRSSRPEGHSGVAGALSTDDLNCGLAFSSRPSALSFWAKYSPKNSADKGLAMIAVYDADGNTIASGSIEINPADQYSNLSIPLTYADGAAKAHKIYVKFLSTNTEASLAKDNNWITPPPFANLSDAKYLGSQLFIDDIELTY